MMITRFRDVMRCSLAEFHHQGLVSRGDGLDESRAANRALEEVARRYRRTTYQEAAEGQGSHLGLPGPEHERSSSWVTLQSHVCVFLLYV